MILVLSRRNSLRSIYFVFRNLSNDVMVEPFYPTQARMFVFYKIFEEEHLEIDLVEHLFANISGLSESETY